MPEHVKAETSSQTYLDYLRLEKEWAAHLSNNYYSDMTPQARKSVVPKAIPLELIQIFGPLRHEAWDRIFMNEEHQDWFSQEETKIACDPKTFPFDLTTSEGKREFEDHINDFNEKCPGALAPRGQNFDFKTYYSELGV